MKYRYITGILILLAAVGAYCGYRWYAASYRPEKLIEESDREQLELFESVRPEIITDENSAAAEATGINDSQESPAEDDTVSHIAGCEAVNDETVGWIYIPGTHIDYPVMQSADNDFYLHHGFDREYNNELGCPFLDYRCSSDFSGLNSIVYAHYMADRRMFADVSLYKDSSYMESCPEGYLVTPEGQHKVRFFAYLSVPADAPVYHTVFMTENDRSDYIDYLFTEADYTYGITAGELKERSSLHLLMLSTCTFEYDDSRGVLAGIIADVS